MYVGVDVAKGMLDVAVEPTGETWRTANAPERIGELVATSSSRWPRWRSPRELFRGILNRIAGLRLAAVARC